MAGGVAALAAELDLVRLLLAVVAAVLAPFAAFLNGAFAGRMGALGRICHREPPERTLYASFRPARGNDFTGHGWLRPARALYSTRAIGTIYRHDRQPGCSPCRRCRVRARAVRLRTARVGADGWRARRGVGEP